MKSKCIYCTDRNERDMFKIEHRKLYSCIFFSSNSSIHVRLNCVCFWNHYKKKCNGIKSGSSCTNKNVLMIGPKDRVSVQYPIQHRVTVFMCVCV